MRKIRIKVTELEVDVEDPQVTELLQRALGSPLSPAATQTATARQLPPGEPAADLPPATPSDVDTTTREPGARARQRPAKKRGPTRHRARAPSEEAEKRQDLIEKICSSRLAEDEQYNAAIRSAANTGDRAMLVLHLAKTQFDLAGLISPEVTRILEGKFSTPVKTQAVTMALVRAAAIKGLPRVAGRQAVWARDGTEYWLTQSGTEHVETLLQPES